MFTAKLISRLHNEHREAIVFQATCDLIAEFMQDLKEHLSAVLRADPDAVSFNLGEEEHEWTIRVDTDALTFRINKAKREIMVLANWELKDTIRYRDGEMVGATLYPEINITREHLDGYLEFVFDK